MRRRQVLTRVLEKAGLRLDKAYGRADGESFKRNKKARRKETSPSAPALKEDPKPRETAKESRDVSNKPTQPQGVASVSKPSEEKIERAVEVSVKPTPAKEEPKKETRVPVSKTEVPAPKKVRKATVKRAPKTKKATKSQLSS